MQELHDTGLLQELGSGERRRAGKGVILLLVVANRGVQTFAVIESATDRVAMEEVALLGGSPDPAQVGVENPIKSPTALDAQLRTGQWFHVHIIRRNPFGDLHQITTDSRGHDRPHLVLFLGRHFGLAERRRRLSDNRQGHCGCGPKVRVRIIEFINDVLIDATIENLARGLLHQALLVALALEDVEPRFADQILAVEFDGLDCSLGRSPLSTQSLRVGMNHLVYLVPLDTRVLGDLWQKA